MTLECKKGGDEAGLKDEGSKSGRKAKTHVAEDIQSNICYTSTIHRNLEYIIYRSFPFPVVTQVSTGIHLYRLYVFLIL